MEELAVLEQRLAEAVQAVQPADQGKIEAARRRWDMVAKPLHGLGLLEDTVARMAGIAPLKRDIHKCVATFCADNGVVAEGVTQLSLIHI